MTTTFFRFKKFIKRFIKTILPNSLYKNILLIYRFFFSKIPNFIHKKRITRKFKEKSVVTIKNSTIKIIVDPINGGTDAELFLNKERDSDVISIMKSTLKHGDGFLDIGANIGYETLWGSHLVSATGKVYAFEPLPNLVKQIEESINLNNFSNITIFEKAAGNEKKSAKIYSHKEDAGLTSLSNIQGASTSIEIEISRVDEELPQGVMITLIKLDVEGYEYEALQGAVEVIRKNKPLIIFEFSPHLYERDFKGKSLQLLKLLSSLGYAIFSIGNLTKEINETEFEELIEKILIDETIPNFVAKQKFL